MGIVESDIQIHYFNEDYQGWEPLPQHLDTTINRVVVGLDHFSIYALAGAITDQVPNPDVPGPGLFLIGLGVVCAVIIISMQKSKHII